MDAFGRENLEETVEDTLERKGLDRRVSATEDHIRVRVNDIEHEQYEEVFEDLYNPVDGELSEMPAGKGFQLRSLTKFVIGWGTEEYTEKTNEVSASEIDEIKKLAVEDSFEEGYSSFRFRELYREMR